jgi:hypothetical protein
MAPPHGRAPSAASAFPARQAASPPGPHLAVPQGPGARTSGETYGCPRRTARGLAYSAIMAILTAGPAGYTPVAFSIARRSINTTLGNAIPGRIIALGVAALSGADSNLTLGNTYETLQRRADCISLSGNQEGFDWPRRLLPYPYYDRHRRPIAVSIQQHPSGRCGIGFIIMVIQALSV